MRLLCDNDVLLKLAVCNLLSDALLVLGVEPQATYVLPSTSFRLKAVPPRAKSWVRDYGAEAIARLVTFVQGCPELGDALDRNVFATLQYVREVDEGEAVLLAVACAWGDAYLLTTGDKTCLKALATLPDLRTIAEQVAGHIVCLEQIILKVMEIQGFDYVRDRVAPACAYDKVLQVAFGSRLATQESVAREALTFYVSELRALPTLLLTSDL